MLLVYSSRSKHFGFHTLFVLFCLREELFRPACSERYRCNRKHRYFSSYRCIGPYSSGGFTLKQYSISGAVMKVRLVPGTRIDFWRYSLSFYNSASVTRSYFSKLLREKDLNSYHAVRKPLLKTSARLKRCKWCKERLS